MAIHDPDMPHTQTSAPTEPASTTQDPTDTAPRRDAANEEMPESGEPSWGVEHMPVGADEPGAGL